MPATNLKITARRLLRQKTFSLINIFGLSMGLAACLLIYLYVRHELSYDTYHPNADRVARVTTILHSAGSDVDVAIAPFPAAGYLARSFPEVQAAARIDDESNLVIKAGNEIFSPKYFYLLGTCRFLHFRLYLSRGDRGRGAVGAKFRGHFPVCGKEIFRRPACARKDAGV